MPLILVVEDDVEMNELQRELLSLHGMESLPAYSGSQALELCEQHPIDAVLLDIMLPEMDGFETCRLFRQRQTERRLPVIMLTALDSDDCRRRGAACGADAYFVKPFDPDEVVRTLQTLIAETKGE
ncbi:MAG: response regulator [Phycisphaerae bacterium]|nr:response regulator [Phycisphaerae bacterium]